MLLFWLLMLLTWPAGADATPTTRLVIDKFRQQQVVERRAAAHEQETLKAHIDQMQDMRAQLSLPRDAKADRNMADAIARDQTALATSLERMAAAERAINGDFLGVPLDLSGTVEFLKGKNWQPLSLNNALFPGQVVRVGSYGGANFLFEDGSQVHLFPGVIFQLYEHTATDTLFRLNGGRIHVVHFPNEVGGIVGRVRYQTPTTIVTLGGTEFDLWIDSASRTHLQLMAGSIELEAFPENKSLGTQGPSGRSLDLSPLLAGKWMRILTLAGDVHILRRDGIPRKAVVGAELSPGERVETGDSGFTWVLVRGGYQIAMKSQSRLAHVSEGKRFSYRLEKGLFRISSVMTKESTENRPLLRTLTNEATVQNTECDVAVDPYGNADWTLVKGTIALRAKSSK